MDGGERTGRAVARQRSKREGRQRRREGESEINEQRRYVLGEKERERDC